MDTAPRIEALRTAKMLIASHGLVAHMNKYNRDSLARDMQDDADGLRYDFHLDPTKTSWSDSNPSCSLLVRYTVDPKGNRIDETGAMVLDNTLRVAISASANDMDVETFRRRESMLTMLGMLCDMLSEVLPSKLTLIMQTPQVVVDNARKAFEQQVGQQIFKDLGGSAFKGLRCDSAGGRTIRLTSAYASPDGKYPESGTYRFRHVRTMDRRGNARDVAYYSIRVFGNDGTVPPTVSIRRVSSLP